MSGAKKQRENIRTKLSRAAASFPDRKDVLDSREWERRLAAGRLMAGVHGGVTWDANNEALHIIEAADKELIECKKMQPDVSREKMLARPRAP